MKFICLLLSIIFGVLAGVHAAPAGMDSVQLRAFVIVFLAAAFLPWEQLRSFF